MCLFLQHTLRNHSKFKAFSFSFPVSHFSKPLFIMGVFTYESEITCSIPPARFFKAFVLDEDNFVPKVAPQAVKQVEILEGDGGPGTIKKITFREGSKFKYVKRKVESIDKENLSHSYSIIGGDALEGNRLEKITYESKFVASADGGCIIKTVSKYCTIGDAQIKEDEVKEGKEQATQMFKLFEGYLKENPDTYN
ncbi:major allergen Pru av 1-like [Humulus lupulus]|uniref:major allergen Pru av 1-like n=1 Tax=Humulus lupulus TaxID=3486 RepID=UPI002B40783A|nr:major allergen Pru av 1-like [Humulus lupulus]